MRIRSLVLVPLLLLAAPSSAQRAAITINTATPEGRLLEQIRQESDDAKKVALAEQFVGQYPDNPAVSWAYSQMVDSCTKTGQFDKALDAAGKVLARDPADIPTAYAAVKAAEAKKDPDAVRKWAVEASGLARKTAQAAKTADEDDDAFQARVASAKNLATYTEYALYAAATQTQDPQKRVDLFKALEEQSPESTYLIQGYGLYFLALKQCVDLSAAVALAERLIPKNQATEEMVATAGEYYLRQNKEPQKVIDYSAKLIAIVNARPRPDGVSDADWQKYKTHYLGWGQWMTGVVYCSQSKFADANKVLREALPLLEDNDEYKAAALFNLGIANVHLKNMADSARFFEQCVAMKSPYQQVCSDNLKSIRSTYRVVK